MRSKVMLVDDHPLFMEGLQYVLKAHGIMVAGTAQTGMEAVEKARTLKPDIILMDILMPGLSGLDALRLIKAEMPEIKIVMLTISEEDEDLFQAVKFGASGYLLKNTNADELINMLTALENNEIPLSSGLASRLLREYKQKEKAHDENKTQKINPEQLTERHLEVLELAAKGITYKEIGEILGLTERTVKYHMGRIIELLQLENRSQVVAYAARMGLIKED
jgi:DNA-binding NarL/FixJ family response regulator